MAIVSGSSGSITVTSGLASTWATHSLNINFGVNQNLTDVTSMSSPSNSSEFIPGRSISTVSASGYLDEDDAMDLSLFQTECQLEGATLTVHFTNCTTARGFSAEVYMTGLSIASDANGAPTWSCTWQITGAITAI